MSQNTTSVEVFNAIQLLLATLLQFTILVLSLALFWREAWLSAFTGVLVLGLSFMPSILAHQFKLVLPVEFSLATTVFLCASYALGEVGDFYARFWWWDLMLHSFSSLTIGLIGFLAIYVFIRAKRVSVPPIYVASMTLCVAVTTGSLWELFEFGMDWFFGFNMQKSGLIDTMTDMLVNTVGALIAALLGYMYVKNGDSLIVDRLIRQFLEKNPQLLRKRRKTNGEQD